MKQVGAFLARLLGRAAADADPSTGAASVRAEGERQAREGVAHYERGELDAAERCFLAALDVVHDLAPAHYYLGLIAAAREDLEETLDRFRLAIHFSPGFAQAHRELGRALQRAGELIQAEAACAQACVLDPADPLSHFTAAGIAKAGGDLERAALRYRSALECRPGFTEALCNLGYVLHQLGRGGEALDCFERALAIDPGFVEAIHNQGLVLMDAGDPQGALACFERARSLRPREPAVVAAVGHALRDLGRLEEAIAVYDATLALHPHFADAVVNRAQTLLERGDFARGWREHERRFDAQGGTQRTRPFRAPRWAGEEVMGKGLVVWGEQGIGDEILFAATYGELVGRGARCVFECAPKLSALFARSFPGAVVVARSDPPHAATSQGIDYQCAAGSLAQHLRPSLASFPSRGAYLAADEARVRHWRERLAELGAGPKVGFCWRSSNTRGKRALSCTQLAQWVELLRVPGVRWVCLQYDQCEAELETARQASGVELHRFPEVDYFNDLDEVSALMQGLDLVISAPTVVSVQAAALGVEVWQMSYGPDWQTHGTSGNVWFPRMTRFERRPGPDWPAVLDAIGRRLRERVES